MNMKKKTTTNKIDRKTHTLDAADKSVGRLATQISLLLRGKHKPTYTPHIDNGDFVVVNNIDKLAFSGKKIEQKKYYHHSLHPGGLKMKKLSTLIKTKPNEILKNAVSRMLPKNRTRITLLKRLTIK